MATIVLKTLAGIDFPILNNGVVIKTISLDGGALINTVSDIELKELRANGFKDLEDRGYAVVNGKSSLDEIVDLEKTKQGKDIKQNETTNNVELKKS